MDSAEGGGDFAGEVDGGDIATGGFLEGEGGGKGFARDAVIAEYGHHLVGELAVFPNLQVRDRPQLWRRCTEGRRAKLRVAGVALQPQLPA